MDTLQNLAFDVGHRRLQRRVALRVVHRILRYNELWKGHEALTTPRQAKSRPSSPRAVGRA